MAEELSLRALNRATLARQLLLERAALDPTTAVAALGGIQAQEAKPAFQALWTRLADFDPAALHAALESGDVVRATMMRATLHLVTAADYAALRPVLQPVLTAAMEGILRQRGDVDLAAVLPAARALLERGPLTFNELRAALAEQFPETEIRALGYAVRMQLPLLMEPTGDRWSFAADSRFRLAPQPLGAGDLPALVRRHLGAFGPASVADIQAWSGLKGLRDVVAGMEDELVAFKHGRRTLYDLPGAPRPVPGVPAPPRLLPEFDDLMLAHQDRTRVITEERRKALATRNLRIASTFLVDGFVAGSWSVKTARGTATLTLAAFEPLARDVRDALAAEAEALLAFTHGDLAPRVEFTRR
jgi:hypothetical protein